MCFLSAVVSSQGFSRLTRDLPLVYADKERVVEDADGFQELTVGVVRAENLLRLLLPQLQPSVFFNPV